MGATTFYMSIFLIDGFENIYFIFELIFEELSILLLLSDLTIELCIFNIVIGSFLL